MGEQWHLLRGGRQSGPHSLDELRGLLTGADLDAERVLVWTERLEEWADPRSVPGVLQAPPRAGAAAVPPPFAVPAPGAVARGTARPAREDLHSLNPYETPASAVALPSPAAVGELGNHPLDVGSCLVTGWKLTLSHFGKIVLFGLSYVGAVLVLSLAAGMVQALAGAAESNGSTRALGVAAAVFVQIFQNAISIFFNIGASMFALSLVRRTNPSISMLFAGGPFFWRSLLAWIVMWFALAVSIAPGMILLGVSQTLSIPDGAKIAGVVLGFVMMMVPALFIGLRLGQFQFAIIDQGLGPVAALKASWRITRGNFWNLVLLALASMAIGVVGMLALLVGLLWAVPTVMLAGASAYVCMCRGPAALPRFD